MTQKGRPTAGVFLPDDESWSIFGRADLRSMVVAGLILSYIWRFHDLSPAVTPLRLAAVFTVATWSFIALAPRISRLRAAWRLAEVRCFVLWTAWIVVAASFAIAPGRSWDFVTADFVKSVAMAVFLVGSLGSFKMVRFGVAVHLVGAAVIVFYYARGGFGTWRAPVPTYDVNDMAFLLNMVLPLAVFSASMARSWMLKVPMWTLAALMAVSVITTHSRGGFVTLAGISLFMLVRLGGASVAARVLPVVLLMVGVGVASEETRTRLGTLLDLEEDYNVTTEEGRFAIWRRAIGYMNADPLTGLGTKNFPAMEALARGDDRGYVTHNSFLEVGAETGYVGLALFVGMILGSLRALRRLRRRYVEHDLPELRVRIALCDALTASLLAYVIGGSFLSHAYSPMLLSIVALVVGCELADKEVRYHAEKFRPAQSHLGSGLSATTHGSRGRARRAY